jgi:hypothetical protein
MSDRSRAALRRLATELRSNGWRVLAASGPLPPRLAARFTTGCMAVLRVIADGTKGNAGLCIKSVAELAARAGVCHRLGRSMRFVLPSGRGC